MKEDRKEEYSNIDYLYLIHPLLTLMQTHLHEAWIPRRDLMIGELLWVFKGLTFLKRFMKDKQKC